MMFRREVYEVCNIDVFVCVCVCVYDLKIDGLFLRNAEESFSIGVMRKL